MINLDDDEWTIVVVAAHVGGGSGATIGSVSFSAANDVVVTDAGVSGGTGGTIVGSELAL